MGVGEPEQEGRAVTAPAVQQMGNAVPIKPVAASCTEVVLGGRGLMG